METHQAQSKPQTRKREKPILSCNFCRGRKQSPCGACTRRGKPTECIFTCSEQERKDAIDYRPHNRSQKARQRIARLENLVTELRDKAESSNKSMSDTAQADNASSGFEPTASGTSPNVRMGNLNLADDQAVYTGSSHWATILEDIQQLRDELTDDGSDIVSEGSSPFASGLIQQSQTARISLLANVSCLPVDQILALVPPRKIVDRYIFQYFNTFDSIILHRGKFLAEYANFWVNPSGASIIWVGFLFSIMSMAVSLQKKEAGVHGVSASELQTTLDTYRTLTIHCLVAGDYLRSSAHTVETLILHFAVDQEADADANIGNWVLMGVIIRIAMRMGLHREPSHWPNIRPLQAELRRRAWTALYSIDFFTSTQIGLPRIIKDSQCDTRPPSYLLDSDIGFEHNSLPPERPHSEPSMLAFNIHRHGVIKVAAEIYDTTEAGPPSPATIATLQAKLERATDSLPDWLRLKPLEESIADSPATILNRMMLDIITQKAIYLLHRHSFVRGSAGEESVGSNEICIKAALAILEHQRRMNEETQPGGLMYNIRWRVAAPLRHEFMQATMMLCFALSRYDAGRDLHRRSDILRALILAKDIWETRSDQSLEAQRAVKAISVMLEQDRKGSVSVSSPSTAFNHSSLSSAENHLGGFDNTFGQTMALDPSFFSVGDDMTALSKVMDEFMNDTAATGLSSSPFGNTS
ncbi:fungal-specific transcription factor domain-containing protein [Fusarium oxysporum f. sp. albedinis]|nr:fungal-specific transcription factor domain-containing protein [Fusarium oxysporum f. sp. albedinis]